MLPEDRKLQKELDGLLATIQSQIVGAQKHYPHDAILLADLKARAQTIMLVRVLADRIAANADDSDYVGHLQSGGSDPECNGHPAGPFDPMGQTVYCDGRCRQ